MPLAASHADSAAVARAPTGTTLEAGTLQIASDAALGDATGAVSFTGNAGLQAAENSRLLRQNEILTNKLAAAQVALAKSQAEGQQLGQQLATARTALGLQQDHLQQLQSEKQLLAVAGATVIHQNACINNLRMIDAAKQQWALEKSKNDDAVPSAHDLLPYLTDGVFPVCPEGGTYSINAIGQLPTCSIPGHALPQ